MKIVIGAGVGAVVLFVWSFASWMIIPWHRMEKLPNEQQVAAALQENTADSGVYISVFLSRRISSA